MRQSSVAWSAIVGGVIAYELYCDEGELLSQRVDEWLEHPVKRVVAYGAIGLTALHLLNHLERGPLKKIDPWHQLGRVATRSIVDEGTIE